jgi:SRSO17 transposase
MIAALGLAPPPPARAALGAGVLSSWVLGDSVCGCDKGLRVMLEKRGKPYVLAVRSDERHLSRAAFSHVRSRRSPRASRRKTGIGCRQAKARKYQALRLARVRLLRLQAPPCDHWLLIRRSISDPKDMAIFVTFAPHKTELKEIAAVAGLRWTIEDYFQSAKDEAGLDHCEARSWHARHRHMTLSLLALALSTIIAQPKDARGGLWQSGMHTILTYSTLRCLHA